MSNRRRPKNQRKPIFNRGGVGRKINTGDQHTMAVEFPAEIEVPLEEKALLKQVPAKVDGVVVGVANLYDDGSVDVIIDEDAPEEAVNKIRAMEKQMAYTLGLKGN